MRQRRKEISELATRILKVMKAYYAPDGYVTEGTILYDAKEYDPTIQELYRFPHEFDEALKELAQAKYIEKHAIFPNWKILK